MYFEKRLSKKSKKGYTWQVCFYYDDPETGIRKRYKKSGFETKQEAQKHGQEALKMLSDGLNPKERRTLSDVYSEWLKLNSERLAPSTINRYDASWKYLQNISKLSVSSLKYSTLQELFNSLDLSKSSKNNIKALLLNLFKFAIRAGYIENNPVQYIEITGKEKKPTEDALELSEVEDICKSIGTHNQFTKQAYQIFMWIGYYTGFRASEILALEWSDIDFDNCSIHVWRRQEHGTNTFTERMKTRSSAATVPMCEPLKQILKEWHKENQNGLLICSRNGAPILYQTISNNLKAAAKKTGIDFHCHMLRHTFITNVMRSGADPKTAAQLARHSDISTTLNIYTQMNQGDLKTALNKAYPKSPK